MQNYDPNSASSVAALIAIIGAMFIPLFICVGNCYCRPMESLHQGG